jgi:hypothetical protein
MKATEGASLTPTELIDELRKWVIVRVQNPSVPATADDPDLRCSTIQSHRKIMHWAVAQGTQAFVFPERMKDHIVREPTHLSHRC